MVFQDFLLFLSPNLWFSICQIMTLEKSKYSLGTSVISSNLRVCPMLVPWLFKIHTHEGLFVSEHHLKVSPTSFICKKCKCSSHHHLKQEIWVSTWLFLPNSRILTQGPMAQNAWAHVIPLLQKHPLWWAVTEPFTVSQRLWMKSPQHQTAVP